MMSDGVKLRIPTDPTVCGAIGCTESRNLLEVTTNEGTRVLCPDHVDGWIRRSTRVRRSRGVVG